MLKQISKLFDDAWNAERAANKALADALPSGKAISFRKGNMRSNDNAEVLMVSGRRLKIRNLFSKAEMWIDFSDIQGVREYDRHLAEKQVGPKWYSTNEEDFCHTEIDDAVREVFDYIGAKPGDVRLVWEGDAVIPKAGQFVPAALISDLNNCAGDECGEYAGTWPDCTKEQEKDLDERVAAVVNAWADDHGLQPTFGTVENVRDIEVRLIDEDGNWEYVYPEASAS